MAPILVLNGCMDKSPEDTSNILGITVGPRKST